MTDYTVRVVLHDATADDYEKLHKAMEASGYSREVRDRRNVRYQLPHAEYVKDGFFHSIPESVKDDALRIARTIRPEANILVTECIRRAWHLDEIKRT